MGKTEVRGIRTPQQKTMDRQLEQASGRLIRMVSVHLSRIRQEQGDHMLRILALLMAKTEGYPYQTVKQSVQDRPLALLSGTQAGAE